MVGGHETGLSDEVTGDLQRIFELFPVIERVLLFGSRAKNTYKPWSDIDLAVIAESMSTRDFNELWSMLDTLPLVFKLDVLHWNTLENSVLRQRVLQEGIQFWPNGH